jgi:subtilisin family serine protease
MSRLIVSIVLAVLCLFVSLATGPRSVLSYHGGQPSGPSNPKKPYRSVAPSHKAIVYNGDEAAKQQLMHIGASVLQDYGSFSLLSVPDSALTSAAADAETSAVTDRTLRDDLNLILLRASTIDTARELSAQNRVGGSSSVNSANAGEASGLGTTLNSAGGLQLVQMMGPVKAEWIKWLSANAEIISYVPNNAYLVRWRSGSTIDPRQTSPSIPDFIQWAGEYSPKLKIAPEISQATGARTGITIQLVTTGSLADDISAISRLSSPLIGRPTQVLNYTNVRVSADPSSIQQIAEMADVIWIEPWIEPRLLDERQDQLIAGNYTGTQLVKPVYLGWLQGYGLATAPDFVVDVTDSGIDRGSLDPAVIHKAFLSVGGLTRIAYANYESAAGNDGPLNDIIGHGTLNASIAGGYDNGTAFPDIDPEGYRLALGVAPFAQLGITKIFDPSAQNAEGADGYLNPNLPSILDAMYSGGARISNNSWGEDGAYTTMSQIYDQAVRDAQPEVAGNQELTAVFAVGNEGPGGHIQAPSNAKNVIAVGASQSEDPFGTDGCQIGPSGADDPTSIIGFSSGGPTADGRIKPDIVAPGTHIQGALSQDPANTASEICGPKDYPAGQTLYTWSSGTSHSTPAVSGAAALLRQYFEQTTGSAPSPAMVKAYLLNSTTYLTGAGANDNLPGRSQGWGALNLGMALDGVPRVLLDQSQLLTTTGQTYTLRCHIADASTQVRVTLAWTDAPGNPAAAAPQVNDLDLQVLSSGNTYLGNNFNGSLSVISGSPDKLNNVESVWFPAGTSGDITINVIAANLAGDGVPGNSTKTDQDFALVVYNARPDSSSGLDPAPQVSLGFPAGGEKLVSGSAVQLQWSSSDDTGITSQRIDFSSDGGVTYTTLASVAASVQDMLWVVPQIATTTAKIRITATDGVNLPVSASNASDFEIDVGPPETTPPTVSLAFPTGTQVVGGGNALTINWTESDNIGVVNRVVQLSTDGGASFQQIATVPGPSLSHQQSYQWQVPASFSTDEGVLQVTVFNGAGISASSSSPGQFQIWALPVVTSASYMTLKKGKAELLIDGRNFRKGQAGVFVNGIELSKLTFKSPVSGSVTFGRIVSNDKKLQKDVPSGQFSTLVVKVAAANQASPDFEFKRKKSD